MAGRPEMSTSCSFGMMAGLSRVGLTDSPCASILVGEQGTKAKNAARHQNHQSGERMIGKSLEKVLNVRRMDFNGGAHWGKYKQIHVEHRMGMNEIEIGRGEARRGEGDSCVP